MVPLIEPQHGASCASLSCCACSFWRRQEEAWAGGIETAADAAVLSSSLLQASLKDSAYPHMADVTRGFRIAKNTCCTGRQMVLIWFKQ